MGRGSSVGIATRFWLEGPGDERFSAPTRTGPGAHPAYFTECSGSFLGVKRPGHGVNHPHQSSTDVKGRVELYLYSPAVSS